MIDLIGMSEPIKKADIEETLDISVKRGIIYAACPICSEYLSYNEYELLNCNKCKKIKFKDIKYYPAAKKENN
jgi:exosome complex RNA-binding protein Csl4